MAAAGSEGEGERTSERWINWQTARVTGTAEFGDRLDALPVPTLCLDRNECVTFANRAFYRWLGAEEADLCGCSLREVIGSLSYDRLRRPLAAALADESAAFFGTLQPSSGEALPVRITFHPPFDPGGARAPVFVLIEALPDRTFSSGEDDPPLPEATVPQLRRIRALGEMTAALAHELTQPLAATLAYIQGSLRLIRAATPASPEVIEGLEMAAKQARQASDLVHHIRRFARHDPLARSLVNIPILGREVAELLASELQTHHVTLTVCLPDDLPEIPAEAIALKQVMLNLLHNSIEALADHPVTSKDIRITGSVKSAGTAESSRIVESTGALEGDAVLRITVSDNGPGFPPALIDRLFLPLPTPKPNGLGLGLAICRTIIREHGGDLWLAASSPSGAAFAFEIPINGLPIANPP